MARQLLIDIGNSRIKWAIKQGEQFNPAVPRTHRGHQLVELLEMDFAQLEPPDRIFVSCVGNADKRDTLTGWIESHWHVTPHYLVSSRQEAGVQNAYEHPHTLGSDRWAAMIAAYAEAKAAVCVVDAGTALTIDVIDPVGKHVGGMILPGLMAMQAALFGPTALPPMNIESVPMGQLLGTTTHDCIGLGIQHAVAALFVRLFTQLKQDFGREPRCYLTGGDAPVAATLLPVTPRMDPYLVLKGLALLVSKS